MIGGVALSAGWWIWLARFRTYCSWILLLVCFCLGAAHHQQTHQSVQNDGIAGIASEQRQLVRLRGTLANSPEIRQVATSNAIGDEQYDWSRAIVKCNELINSDGSALAITGRMELSAVGHLAHVGVGDCVEVTGWLTQPRRPANPGAFDFSLYLRRQGIGAIVRTNSPDAVRLLAANASSKSIWNAAFWQSKAKTLFTESLSPQNVGVAQSLFLGNRTDLDADVQTMFIESGTMHLLAISGLHVGILAGFLFIVARSIGLQHFTLVSFVLIGLFLLCRISRSKTFRHACDCFHHNYNNRLEPLSLAISRQHARDFRYPTFTLES